MASPATVERVDLTVVYDGEAMREHRMDVRDLAPALIGLADVFQDANEALNPGEPPVTLDIRATDQGSFMIELQVVHETIVQVLNSPDAVALTQLLALVGGGTGLFVYLRSKFRRGAREETLPNGSVRIFFPDNTSIEFPPEVIDLARRATIRQGVRSAVEPLARDGITRMELRSENNPQPVVIESTVLPAVDEATSDDQRGPLITDQRYTQTLTVTSPNFTPGNKWRLNEGGGQASTWMAMDDINFMSRINQGEIAFRSGDRLQAEVWLRQWAEDSGDIHTERSITHVVQHLPRPVSSQPSLPGLFGGSDHNGADQTDDGEDGTQ